MLTPGSEQTPKPSYLRVDAKRSPIERLVAELGRFSRLVIYGAPPMPTTDASDLLGPELASALSQKGYATLTAVQEAVLAPELTGRDLRISSQTGSGKTLAIGFAVRHGVGPSEKASDGIARPQAVVITPTRELAKQVELELRWLYAPSK